MDFHVITSRGSDLVAQLVDGKLVIVPPVEPPATAAGDKTGPGKLADILDG